MENKEHGVRHNSNALPVMSDKISRSEADSPEKSITMSPPSVEDDHSPTDGSDHHQGENFDENGLEKAATGAPLDRTQSQAQKLGKKKILIIMPALCVCLSLYMPRIDVPVGIFFFFFFFERCS